MSKLIESLELTSNLYVAVNSVFDEMFSREVVTINIVTPEGIRHAHDFSNVLLSIRSHMPQAVFRLDSSSQIKTLPKRKKIFSIFLVQNEQQFLAIFRKVTPEIFRFNGRFVVVLTDGENFGMNEIFEHFWQKMIYNVIVIFENENRKVLIYTFFPFNHERCDDVRPVKINIFENSAFVNGLGNIFHSKVENIFNCPVRVAIANNKKPYISIKKLHNGTMQLDGQNIKLLTAVAERLKFRTVLTYVGRDGTFYENGTSDGILGTLLDDRADMALGHLWMKSSRLAILGATNAYASEQQMLVVPPGKIRTPLQKLVVPLTTTVWLIIFVIYSTSFVVISVVKKLKLEAFVFGAGVKHPKMNVFVGLLGGTVKVLPRRNFARFLLMAYLMYSLVIRSIYQGSFYHIAQAGDELSEFETIQQMIDQNFIFYINNANADTFQANAAIRGRF